MENRIPFRRKMQMATIASEIVGDFNKVWKFARKYPYWLSKIYNRIVVLAEKRKIDIPKPKINMSVIK